MIGRVGPNLTGLVHRQGSGIASLMALPISPTLTFARCHCGVGCGHRCPRGAALATSQGSGLGWGLDAGPALGSLGLEWDGCRASSGQPRWPPRPMLRRSPPPACSSGLLRAAMGHAQAGLRVGITTSWCTVDSDTDRAARGLSHCGLGCNSAS